MLMLSLSSALAQLPVEEATERLRSADTFQDARIGYGGELSPNVEAYRVLVAHPKGEQRLRELANTGTVVGRLYAVAGLIHLNASVDAELEALDVVGSTVVPTQGGCFTREATVADLLRTKKRPRVEVGPGQSYDDWFRDNRSGHLDIVHGGYPGSFLDR